MQRKCAKFLLAFCTIILLFGCGEDSPSKKTYKKVTRPEDVTIAFLQAIYTDNDIERAKSLSTEGLAANLDFYKLTKTAQRHLFNLVMTNVSFKIEEMDIDFFHKTNDSTNIMVKFAGIKENEPWLDSRRLKVEKQRDNSWLVSQVYPE